MQPYIDCPVVTTKSFILRRIRETDSEAIFRCYNDKEVVELMNDDNCDFGFFVDSVEKMSETIRYWIDFFEKGYFIRFAVVDRETEKAVGTVEGFDAQTGVLRIDLASAYETQAYLSEIIDFAQNHFRAYFGNEYLVTKAIDKAAARRSVLEKKGWEYIDKFMGYTDYYKIKL